MSAEKTVLSIQSHVTHGYVGNSAATFPLQLHGFDVDAVNTVSLSNHSGYPVIRGHRMDLAEFTDLLDGIRANGFLSSYRYVLTGYINNVDIVLHVKNVVEEIRAARGEGRPLTFICDPVMGDDGIMYCKKEVVDAYRILLGCADIATPNYYEASVITGIEVRDIDTAIQAADWLHEKGTKKVVIKSFRKEGDDFLTYLASEKNEDGSSGVTRYVGKLPYYSGRYTGTGDAFAASLLAFSTQHTFPAAVATAMGVLQDLIQVTRQDGGGDSSSLAARELKVVKSPAHLLNPTTKISYEKLN